VVYERLYLSAGLGDAKDLSEELLDDTQMSLLIECSIERKNWPRSFETVADEVEFFHGMQVLQVHLHSRTIWWLGHPAVQILTLAGFEEENIVAVVQFC
jgi:hypothetical protein